MAERIKEELDIQEIDVKEAILSPCTMEETCIVYVQEDVEMNIA